MASLVEKINGVGVYISRGIQVIDNFLSTSRTSPASARTIKVLNDKIGDEAELPNPLEDVVGNISELNTNLIDISFRYDSESGKPQWKERGADTWINFSSD